MLTFASSLPLFVVSGVNICSATECSSRRTVALSLTNRQITDDNRIFEFNSDQTALPITKPPQNPLSQSGYHQALLFRSFP